MKRRTIETKIYEKLLERFGEPIGKTVALVGAADEGPGGKKTYKDKPTEKPWNSPEVVHEGCCKQCGMMPTQMDQAHSCGEAASEGDELAEEEATEVNESRDRVSPVEVEQTWEDLFKEFGKTDVAQIASWLGATPKAVAAALPRYLTIKPNGEVVEKGISTDRMKAVVPPAKATG